MADYHTALKLDDKYETEVGEAIIGMMQATFCATGLPCQHTDGVEYEAGLSFARLKVCYAVQGQADMIGVLTDVQRAIASVHARYPLVGEKWVLVGTSDWRKLAGDASIVGIPPIGTVYDFLPAHMVKAR